MGDECEKTCPLCAEEMDLTDQQLKPCKCGYEICVWCWHQIMDLAEKNESEGRCPACRTPYDKDKIVGMAANCERLVGINMEKKQKSQKGKNKTSESRKQLTSVRVIQRNLVYIVGLPLDLADEDLLQGKDYFSQYGKVLKVSISRTSTGTIQQFANETCSVYITYSKEEEAVRCIQSVHGFILDGWPLRACFGTTKYCHAWLRNAPCSNPDCLYLHEIGSQEDSFTKDEIISAYTRVQQITGVTNNLQRRAGSVLPSPVDDYCNHSSEVIAKPIVKSSANSTNSTKSSPPNSSSGRSGALPPAASWGSRVSNSNLPTVSSATSNGPAKQKGEAIHGTPLLATTVSDSVPVINSDVGKKKIQNEETYVKQTKNISEIPGTMKQHSGINSMVNGLEVSCSNSVQPSGKSTSPSSCSPPNASGIERSEENKGSSNLDVKISSISVDEETNNEHDFEVTKSDDSNLNNYLQSISQGLPLHDSDMRSDSHLSVTQNLTSETEDDFNNQRLQDAIVVNQTNIPTSSTLHLLSHYTVNNPPTINRIPDEGLVTNVSSASLSSNGFLDVFVNRNLDQGNSLLFKGGQENHTGIFKGGFNNFDSQPAMDMGENNIISNILSLDLDSWDEPLTSPQNLAKLLCEMDKQEGPIKVAGSLKGQNSNQSRFSFARQEDNSNHLFDREPSLGNIGQAVQNPSFGQDLLGNRDPYLDRIGNGFGFPHHTIDSSDNLTNGHSIFPSSNLSFSRSQISAPPGFSAPSRPPPPGFSSYERNDQPFNTLNSGNHLVETSSFFRNLHQASPNGKLTNNNEIELFDPAILAVGEGRLPIGLNNSISTFENNTRLHALMQRSLSPNQNLRYNDFNNNFSLPNDVYGFKSRHMDESQVNNHSPFTQFSLQQPRNTGMLNNPYGWNDLQVTNDVGMSELLRSDRLGINKFYGGYEDSNFRMTNNGDLYNRSFGM